MPIIEEVVDEDVAFQDYDEGDFDDFNPFDRSMKVEGRNLRPTQKTHTDASEAKSEKPLYDDPPVPIPELVNVGGHQQPATFGNEAPEHTKSWPVIYPIYFDSKRSSREGRRVAKRLAVDNPLVVSIAAACKSFNLNVALELTKTHPQDWANPGRVRVDHKGPKAELYKRICQFLKTYVVTEETAGISLYRSIAQFDNLRPLAVPKGMKFNKILPGVSPAISAKKAIQEAMSGGGPGGDNLLAQMGKMFGM